MSRFIVTTLFLTITANSALAQRLLILNKEDATLSIVDAASGKTLATITTGAGPHEVVVSDDGKYAFASNYGTGPAPGNSISMIDLTANKELRRIEVSPLSRPHGLWWANARLYFTAEADRKIARYDPAANNIDWIFETGQAGTHMVHVSKDGHTIVTANIAGNSISLIEQDPKGGWTQSVIPTGTGPEGFDVTPNGREIWAAHSRDGGVSVIDIAAKKVVQTLPLGTKRSNRLKITPDGRHALISDLDAGELVIVDVAARKELKRVPLGRMLEGILIPDNSRAFVAVTGENYVAEVDLKTWAVRRKVVGGKGPDGMAWLR